MKAPPGGEARLPRTPPYLGSPLYRARPQIKLVRLTNFICGGTSFGRADKFAAWMALCRGRWLRRGQSRSALAGSRRAGDGRLSPGRGAAAQWRGASPKGGWAEGLGARKSASPTPIPAIMGCRRGRALESRKASSWSLAFRLSCDGGTPASIAVEACFGICGRTALSLGHRLEGPCIKCINAIIRTGT